MLKNIGLFTKAHNERTRGNSFKLKENRFILDIRKAFFMIRVTRHWTQVMQRSDGCPVAGNVQCWAGL